MGSNEVLLVTLTMLSVAAFMTSLTFSIVNGIPNNGLFNQTIGEVSKKYETYITPADYTFSIWGLIYLWQMAWLLYVISCICRTNAHGMVLMNPVILPKKFHVAWILSNVFTIFWLFLWDREMLLGSALALLMSTLAGYVAVTVTSLATLRYESRLETQAKDDLICIRVLIQNGLDLLFSWATVASLIGISIALAYDPNVAQNWSVDGASTLSLAILAVAIITWSVLENTKLFHLFRYVFAWYGVLLWAFAGILVKNYDISNPNTIYTITLICVTVVCLVAKICVLVLTPVGNPKKYKQFK